MDRVNRSGVTAFDEAAEPARAKAMHAAGSTKHRHGPRLEDRVESIVRAIRP
jgi:hypothetical protein